jgi:hypothetical protein
MKYGFMQAIHFFNITEDEIYQTEKEVAEDLITWDILQMTMYDVQELYVFLLKFKMEKRDEGLTQQFVKFINDTEIIIEHLTRCLMLLPQLNLMEQTTKIVAFMHYVLTKRIREA